MGYHRHHAIIVSTWDKGRVETARSKALEVLGEFKELPESMIGPVMGPMVNGFCSFLIATDGSKEWWSTSDQGDEFRARFIEWMKAAHLKDSLWLDWVHVQYGDEDGDQKMLEASQ